MRKILFIAITLLTVGLLLFAAFAAPSKTFNFQGRIIKPDGTPLTGTQPLMFMIYNASNIPVWKQGKSVVLDSNGVFNTILGDGVMPLDLDYTQQYTIEISLGTETFSPRQPLSSLPYGYSWTRQFLAKSGDTMTGTFNSGSNLVSLQKGIFYHGVSSYTDIMPRYDNA